MCTIEITNIKYPCILGTYLFIQISQEPLLQTHKNDGEKNNSDNVEQWIDQKQKHALVAESICGSKCRKHKENSNHQTGSNRFLHRSIIRKEMIEGKCGHQVHDQSEDENPRRVTRLLPNVGVARLLLPVLHEQHRRIPQATEDEAWESGDQNSCAFTLDM